MVYINSTLDGIRVGFKVVENDNRLTKQIEIDEIKREIEVLKLWLPYNEFRLNLKLYKPDSGEKEYLKEETTKARERIEFLEKTLNEKKGNLK